MDRNLGSWIGLQEGFHRQTVHKGEIATYPDEMEMMWNQGNLPRTSPKPASKTDTAFPTVEKYCDIIGNRFRQ